ncbi:STY4851/ECs_5259 family protein [Pseudomonas sp. CCNWLW56]|uniref:STY4851/ECs_5259 family protein n=1 Tax=unclassified Pseudomonas TaxID=196821 RepID=UPI003077DB97
MTACNTITNPWKAWLSEFLLNRDLFKGPNGKPLYSYQLSEYEYGSLRNLLRQHLSRASNPVHALHLGGCFCLFVSEQYRRNYNSSWSWAGAETELSVSLSQAQHSELTSKGLEYWKRPIRYRENGRDWLGSLFAEGGLPWPLVQKDSHGFGKAVRRGIKNFFSTEGNRRTTADLIADYEDELPSSFRNLETRQLLAGIVQQLMYLAEQYPLKNHKDPAAYLDKVAPEWTEAFPIPLDETNARGLINDWLRDAEQVRLGRKEVLEHAKAFTCEHFLQGVLPEWKIRTVLTLPVEKTFSIDTEQLTSTRLELAYYEGEHILARGAAVYGQLTEDKLTVRFSSSQVTLERRRLDEQVTLRLLDNGRIIQCFHFDGSALDLQETPLVFEQRSERWQLVGTSSCCMAGNLARLRLPIGFKISSEGATPQLLAKDSEGGQWLDTSADLSLLNGTDHYRIELNQARSDQNGPTLAGTQGIYDSNPSVTYLGWPRLILPDDYAFRADEIQEFANGQPLDSLRRIGPTGVVRYTLKSRSGKTLLQRRFAVLPKEFSLSLFPEANEKPARLQIKGALQFDLKVGSNLLTSKRLDSEQCATFSLHHLAEVPPASFTLEIGRIGGSHPLQIRLPYPYQGARLIAPDDTPSRVRELTLNQLIGHRITLTSGLIQGQSFHMQMELVCEATPHPKRHYEIKVGSTPTLLNLFSYQNDMLQMLGAVDEQDAFIKLTLETEQRLLSLSIRRYNGRLQWENQDTLTICEMDAETILDGVLVEAMLLSDPKQSPIQLDERKSQNVGTGQFDIPNAMHRKGPWLIYPAKECKIQFRPALFLSDATITDRAAEVLSLHRATQVFHPKTNPTAISQQIAAMAKEFGHSGWQYLADLKQHYAHLPLSSFESWRALSRNPDALAFAVLRLEMDEVFCGRIRDELAVIWEAIPLPVWAEVHAQFLEGLVATGFPESLITSLETNRAAVLRLVVSGFDYLGDYLRTGNKNSLTKIPPQLVVPGWNQALRQQHASNTKWPTDLTMELTSWVFQTPIPAFLREITPVGFTKAVSYLPIFLAYVTAGKATLNDLPVPMAYLKFAIRLVSDFDRQGWFAPTHALMVSYLLASEDGA